MRFETDVRKGESNRMMFAGGFSACKEGSGKHLAATDAHPTWSVHCVGCCQDPVTVACFLCNDAYFPSCLVFHGLDPLAVPSVARRMLLSPSTRTLSPLPPKSLRWKLFSEVRHARDGELIRWRSNRRVPAMSGCNEWCRQSMLLQRAGDALRFGPSGVSSELPAPHPCVMVSPSHTQLNCAEIVFSLAPRCG